MNMNAGQATSTRGSIARMVNLGTAGLAVALAFTAGTVVGSTASTAGDRPNLDACELVKTETLNQTRYVLDGQQRVRQSRIVIRQRYACNVGSKIVKRQHPWRSMPEFQES